MDLVGLLLIGAVLVFGSVYVAWISWAAWQEARASVRETKGRPVSASTWLQHGLTLVFSAIFLSVALSLCFSIVQSEPYAAAMDQFRSLAPQKTVYAETTWGEKGNRGALHATSLASGQRITGASLAYIEFDNSDLELLIEQYPHIDWFILSGTQIDDRALWFLAGHRDLSALTLTDTAITDRGLSALHGNQRLRELDLTRTAITDKGLEVAASLSGLKHLSLGETEVTDEGLQVLEGKENIFSLDVQGTHVSDAAIATLVTLPNLDSLHVKDHQLSAAGIARLKRALPKCDISIHWP